MTTTSPSLLVRDRVPLFPSRTAGPALAAQAAAGGWVRLTFTEQPQQQTEWCWDASTLSVHAYYDPDSTLTQCAFAGRKIGRTDCCAHPDGDACNQPNYPDEALGLLGNFVDLVGPLGIAGVMGQIDAGRPISVRIGWDGGGGHNPLVVGYRSDPTGDWVAVADPWYGPSDVRLATFSTAYQGAGSWTDTYRTKSARLHVGTLKATARAAVNVAARNPQTLDAFAADSTGAILTARHVEGAGWHAWSPLGGGHTAPGAGVAVVSRAAETLDVFSVGTDGHVYTSGWWPGGSAWHTWSRIGTLTVPTTASPHAISRGAQTMDLFVTDAAGGVWTAFWSGGGGWRPWQQLRGAKAASGAPVAGVSRAPGLGDVFAVGADGHVYTSSHGPGSTDQWTAWSRIGSLQLAAGATVSAASRAPDSIDVAATDAHGVVQTATWRGGASPGWSAWTAVPGSRAVAGGPVTVVARDGGLEVVVVWYDGHVAATRRQPGSPGAWKGWIRISPQNVATGVPVSAVARTPTSVDVVFTAVDGSVNAARWAANVADAHWRG